MVKNTFDDLGINICIKWNNRKLMVGLIESLNIDVSLIDKTIGLIDKLIPNLGLETGEVSEALGRGRHTTRFIQIIDAFDGEILDTPGFSSLEFQNMTKSEVRDSFIEFKNFPCPYKDCMHLKECECNKEDMVYIGDAKNDYLSACNAGIDFIAVERYNNCHFDAKIKIADLKELLK